MEKTVTNLEMGEAFGNSDHDSTRFNIISTGKANKDKDKVPDFRASNFEGLRQSG